MDIMAVMGFVGPVWLGKKEKVLKKKRILLLSATLQQGVGIETFPTSLDYRNKPISQALGLQSRGFSHMRCRLVIHDHTLPQSYFSLLPSIPWWSHSRVPLWGSPGWP